jgi:iron complex transport system substrate-binding protein
VCAVSFDDVLAAARTLPSRPRVLSLDPLMLDEVLADLPRLAAAAGVEDAGHRLRERSLKRLGAVESAVAGRARPRVLALEWLEPPFVGGHWVPEMVGLAGGEDVLGERGQRSRTATWEELAGARPDVVIAMPCGYGAQRSAEEALGYGEPLRALGEDRVVAVDASSYFSRPGPRLVGGVELLAGILHPGSCAPPAGGEAIDVSALAAHARSA